MPLSPCSQIGGRGKILGTVWDWGSWSHPVQSAIGCMCLELRRETSDTEVAECLVGVEERKEVEEGNALTLRVSHT